MNYIKNLVSGAFNTGTDVSTTLPTPTSPTPTQENQTGVMTCVYCKTTIENRGVKTVGCRHDYHLRCIEKQLDETVFYEATCAFCKKPLTSIPTWDGDTLVYELKGYQLNRHLLFVSQTSTFKIKTDIGYEFSISVCLNGIGNKLNVSISVCLSDTGNRSNYSARTSSTKNHDVDRYTTTIITTKGVYSGLLSIPEKKEKETPQVSEQEMQNMYDVIKGSCGTPEQMLLLNTIHSTFFAMREDHIQRELYIIHTGIITEFLNIQYLATKLSDKHLMKCNFPVISDFDLSASEIICEAELLNRNWPTLTCTTDILRAVEEELKEVKKLLDNKDPNDINSPFHPDNPFNEMTLPDQSSQSKINIYHRAKGIHTISDKFFTSDSTSKNFLKDRTIVFRPPLYMSKEHCESLSPNNTACSENESDKTCRLLENQFVTAVNFQKIPFPSNSTNNGPTHHITVGSAMRSTEWFNLCGFDLSLTNKNNTETFAVLNKINFTDQDESAIFSNSFCMSKDILESKERDNLTKVMADQFHSTKPDDSIYVRLKVVPLSNFNDIKIKVSQVTPSCEIL